MASHRLSHLGDIPPAERGLSPIVPCGGVGISYLYGLGAFCLRKGEGEDAVPFRRFLPAAFGLRSRYAWVSGDVFVYDAAGEDVRVAENANAG